MLKLFKDFLGQTGETVTRMRQVIVNQTRIITALTMELVV